MKKSILLITAFTLTSCASMYRRSESIEEKMHRYKARDVVTNPVPSYSVSSFPKRGRIPASANQHQDIGLSNKKLYFISLYEQYDSFAQMYPDNKKELSVCPVFHQPLLSYKETERKWSWKKNETVATDGIVSSLAGSGVDQKVRAHMDNNFQEIEKLCLTGASTNYYIYENLITLVRQKNIIKKDKDSLNSLLKTTLYFNESLLSKIGSKKKSRKSGRGLASVKSKLSFSQEAFKRINASWAKSLLK